MENVQELKSSILGFLEKDPEDPTLSGFLDEVALYTDLDGHGGRGQLRDPDDHAQRQGPGVSQRISWWAWRRGLFPGNPRHG